MTVHTDFMVLDLVQELLDREGHNMWRASKAADALNLARFRRLDLLITDVSLPDRSGLLMIQQFREMLPSVPIIVLSGFVGPESAGTREVLKNLGVRHILPIPFSKDVFLTAIRLCLAGRD